MTNYPPNAPCFCGSQRKHKRCCGFVSSEEKRRIDFEAGQLAKIWQFCVSHFDADLFLENLPIFFSRTQEDDFIVEPNSLFAFLMHNEMRGRTACETYLQKKGDTLPTSERQWLETQACSYFSVYEIEQIEDTSITLSCHFTSASFDMKNAAVAPTLNVGEHVLARLMIQDNQASLSGSLDNALNAARMAQALALFHHRSGLASGQIIKPTLPQNHVSTALFLAWYDTLRLYDDPVKEDLSRGHYSPQILLTI